MDFSHSGEKFGKLDFNIGKLNPRRLTNHGAIGKKKFNFSSEEYMYLDIYIHALRWAVLRGVMAHDDPLEAAFDFLFCATLCTYYGFRFSTPILVPGPGAAIARH